MNAQTTLGWDLEVMRGEGWLIVRPVPRGEGTSELVPLADELCQLLERCLVNRVILCLDGIQLLNSREVAEEPGSARRTRSPVPRLPEQSPGPGSDGADSDTSRL